MGAAALRYAELGYSVFPCKPGDKVPLTPHGCKDATTDPERIEQWWTQWPKANIGLATDGLLVVDVDGADNRWPGDPDKAMELAQAPMSRTPRDGRHYIFRQPPGKAWRCTTGRLAAGVDTRADGGYIVVPPSVVNGKPYQFAPGLALDVPPQQLPEPPAWLAAQLDALRQAPAVMADATAQRAIPKGQRNDTLFRLACKLRRDGLSAQAIEAALQAENRQRCRPPLSEDEVTQIAHSAGRYPPGELELPSAVAPEILPYRPFPLDALPEPAQGIVIAIAQAVKCDPAFVALPQLVVLGAAIGNTRRLELDPDEYGWRVPPILWGAIVGESGTRKTAAMRHVLQPVRALEQEAYERNNLAFKQYRRALACWQEGQAPRQHGNTTSQPSSEEPQEPSSETFLVDDITIEALAPILVENPRGVLLAVSELQGWLGGFDRYANKGRASRDMANWLRLFDAEPIIVDRKTGTPRKIRVPEAVVSIIGGIQPGILRRIVGTEYREGGLAARLLLAYPPSRPKQWKRQKTGPQTEAAWNRLVRTLYAVQAGTDDKGRFCPLVVKLRPEAEHVWEQFYNAHAIEQADLTGDLAAAWAKLEQYAARLALIVHYIRWAAGQVRDELLLDGQSMEAGIRLAEWFKHEARRVYATLDETHLERERRELVQWIERRGGTVTAREVQRGYWPLRGPGAAEAALEGLVKAGLGCWEHSPPGQRGQPTRFFRLAVPRQYRFSSGKQQYCRDPERGRAQRDSPADAGNGHPRPDCLPGFGSRQ
jgi:hypothetical protein